MMAEPSLEHLRELMRRVYSDPGEAAARGETARWDMQARYRPERLARFVAAHLQRAAKATEARKRTKHEL